MKTEIEGDVELYVVTDVFYSDRRGNGQKPPWTKPSRQKPLRSIERDFVYGRGFCPVLYHKNWGGSEMCDVVCCVIERSTMIIMMIIIMMIKINTYDYCDYYHHYYYHHYYHRRPLDCTTASPFKVYGSGCEFCMYLLVSIR